MITGADVSGVGPGVDLSSFLQAVIEMMNKVSNTVFFCRRERVFIFVADWNSWIFLRLKNTNQRFNDQQVCQVMIASV